MIFNLVHNPFMVGKVIPFLTFVCESCICVCVFLDTSSILCILCCIRQSTKGKMMSSTAQSHSSLRVPWAMQGLLKHLGCFGREDSDHSPVGDLPSFFFFSACGCWCICIINCQSLLSSQHIKFSSKSACAFVCSRLPCFRLLVVIRWNEQHGPWPLTRLEGYVVCGTLVAVGDCLGNLVPPWCRPSLYSELHVASASWTVALN